MEQANEVQCGFRKSFLVLRPPIRLLLAVPHQSHQMIPPCTAPRVWGAWTNLCSPLVHDLVGERQIFLLPEDSLVLPICMQDAMAALSSTVAVLEVYLHYLCWQKDQAFLLALGELPCYVAAG